MPAADWVEQDEPLTLVGILDDPLGAYAQVGGAGVLSAADLDTWESESYEPGTESTTYNSILVALAPGTDLEAVRAQVEDATTVETTVLTSAEYAKQQASAMTGDQDVFTYVILTFAAIALLVAALVIANTFQVLVAQRTRTLALLRCVGADRRQLARSVLFEAAILGLVASVAASRSGSGWSSSH
ncbi:ABC transporter permease [Oerskovia sp. M15]